MGFYLLRRLIDTGILIINLRRTINGDLYTRKAASFLVNKVPVLPPLTKKNERGVRNYKIILDHISIKTQFIALRYGTFPSFVRMKNVKKNIYSIYITTNHAVLVIRRSVKLAGYSILDIGHSNVQCQNRDIRGVKLAGYSIGTVHFSSGEP